MQRPDLEGRGAEPQSALANSWALYHSRTSFPSKLLESFKLAANGSRSLFTAERPEREIQYLGGLNV